MRWARKVRDTVHGLLTIANTEQNASTANMHAESLSTSRFTIECPDHEPVRHQNSANPFRGTSDSCNHHRRTLARNYTPSKASCSQTSTLSQARRYCRLSASSTENDTLAYNIRGQRSNKSSDRCLANEATATTAERMATSFQISNAKNLGAADIVASACTAIRRRRRRRRSLASEVFARYQKRLHTSGIKICEHRHQINQVSEGPHDQCSVKLSSTTSHLSTSYNNLDLCAANRATPDDVHGHTTKCRRSSAAQWKTASRHEKN